MKRGATIWVAALLLIGSLTGPTLGNSPGTGVGLWCGVAYAAQKTAAQLEAEYGREVNPKKRFSLAVDLMDERLKQMLTAYEADDSAKESEATDHYLSAMDRLEKAMSDHSNGGAVKNAEIRLRRQTKALEDVRMRLAIAEQASVDKALTRVTKLHEQLLDRIMHPRK